MYRYYQVEGGEEAWKPVQADYIARIVEEKHPMFVTVLATDRIASKDMPRDEKLALRYLGPMYVDFDAADPADALRDLQAFCMAIESETSLSPDQMMIYATGSKGFHLEIPMEAFVPKVDRKGYASLPLVYKAIAMKFAQDTIDWRVYSVGMGRMWRQPNVKRPNDRHKVWMSWHEAQTLTPEQIVTLTLAPRELPAAAEVEMNLDLAVIFDKAFQDVAERVKVARKRKPVDPKIFAMPMPSIEALMEGRGIRPGAGFNQLAMQLAIFARETGLTEDALVAKCTGLITEHQSNGNRYNTPTRREEELRRMCRVVGDDPCYEFAAGPIRSLLTHTAPDLDGIAVDAAQITQDIAEAANAPEAGETTELLDEYSDVAGGVEITKYGIYANTDEGKKRICGVGFTDVKIMRSMATSKISAIESVVTVNGKPSGPPQLLEMDVFHSASNLNKYTARFGHAFQGSEIQSRSSMMRVMEKGKKMGAEVFIHTKEGLSMASIPHHENEELRRPFLLWSDGRAVITEPRIAGSGVTISFQGDPDPRGVYRTDLQDAPGLVDWLKEAGSKDQLQTMLSNLFRCQRPDMVGPMMGWLTACFWKPLFQKAYNQFPLMHIAGAAGSGKCLGKDTPVIRANGEIALVQDIQQGDTLLGPDGKARTVLSTTLGRDQLYRITPVKGDSYVVNSAHILSLKKSEARGCQLSDGRMVPANADIVNVNVETYALSCPSTLKTLKGWRAPAVEFCRPDAELPLDAYWLGCWLGDGAQDHPILYKPECNMTRWWVKHAQENGCEVTQYLKEDSPAIGWSIVSPKATFDRAHTANPFRTKLQELGLIKNKHIPAAYKYAPVLDRLKLIAGLLDSDGSLTGPNGYDWISKWQSVAEDFAFMCRSVGLSAYVIECVKGIKTTGFSGTYWRVSISGDTDRIPCLDKAAGARKQIKRHLVSGITVEAIGEGEYYGFALDGDHLFLLGDFTVTHNSQMSSSMARLFYYTQDPKTVSPSSTVFALGQFASGTESIPMIVDEYKPAEMAPGVHDKLKLMFRDAYNARDVQRGGGNRDSDNFRALSTTALTAPIMFIAEGIEEESALMERVVLVTVAPPPSVIAFKWASRFHAFQAESKLLAHLGKYFAAKLVMSGATTDELRAEFDPLYAQARRDLMMSEEAMKMGLNEDQLRDRQSARERSVFNFTVAKFGLMQLKAALDKIFPEKPFEDDFEGFFNAAYVRMKDLAPTTIPEYLKVLNVMVDLSYEDALLPQAIRCGYEYGFSNLGGKDTLELNARAMYSRYRQHCRLINIKPLYSGEQAFVHSLRNVPSLMLMGEGDIVQAAGGTHIFDVDDLHRLGMRGFKQPNSRRR